VCGACCSLTALASASILEMNGDSYRLKQSRRKRTPSAER